MTAMSERGNNATPPAPAIAPGGEGIDPAQVARELGRVGMDARITGHVPGFDAPFFQAGLAGYSDAAMRIIARRHGAPLAVTEALLDRMLLGGGHGFDKADLELLGDALPCSHEDQPLCGQIIGSDPDEMAAGALKMIEQSSRGDKAYRLMAYGDAPGPRSTDPRCRDGSKVGAVAPLPRPDAVRAMVVERSTPCNSSAAQRFMATSLTPTWRLATVGRSGAVFGLTSRPPRPRKRLRLPRSGP